MTENSDNADDSGQFAKETIPASLEQEMRQSYLDYAMSVIVGRALPDVRDGLKPVHRRVLFAMSQLNNDWNKPYKKSARVVGDVIGKYHPHGDTAVYDTIVRMAQDFSLRYPLVDGQGNFGSVDGDSPAAMRYTEIRLAKIAHELIADIDKQTVDFGPNYDESEMQPLVMPTRIPNLLVNGSSGIAVGMATNIPPHNITEVINGCVALIDNSEITIDELMEYIPGPDFPTSGFINGNKGIHDAYKTGRGKIYMRARTHIETNEANGKQSIIATELPYMVNKARLLEKIAELVKAKKIDGITNLRDESDKSGMRMVVELRRGEVAEVILNKLFQQTQLQTVFGINTVALINNQPRIFNLKELLEEFVRHRCEVVTRRSIFELRKARNRAHVLEGLAIAISNIDAMIDLIKSSANPIEAKERMLEKVWKSGDVKTMIERAGSVSCLPDDMDKTQFGMLSDGYHLSEVQAQAILDLRLHRLTGLEQEKLHNEYQDVLEKIAELINVLENTERLMEVVREELVAIRDQYGDERRTEILEQKLDLTMEDLIAEEDLVVTLSHEGYAKSQPLSDYRAQRRGGKGKTAAKTKDDDFVEKLFVANSHDMILCFSSRGKVYWLKVYQLPQAGRAAKGKPLVNLLPMESDESITAVLPVKSFEDGKYIFMTTSDGTVKKTSLEAFSRPRANGIIAIDLVDDNQLVGVGLTDGGQDVMLFSTSGKAIRFRESDVRKMGRTARGVRGIKIDVNSEVNSMIITDKDADVSILTATEMGYGKRTKLEDYSRQGRGGMGTISIQVTERNGKSVGAILVSDEDEAMFITNGGTLVRTRMGEVSVIGRNTQGVRLIDVKGDERLISVEKVAESNEEDEGDDNLDSKADASTGEKPLESSKNDNNE